MAKIIDPEEAKAVLAEQRKPSDQFLHASGLRGTVARAFDIHQALTLWRIGEQNRGSDPNDIMTAIFNVFAGAIAAELQINIVPECQPGITAHLAGEFVERVENVLKTIDEAPSVCVREVGTA